jgi:phosphatidylglycerophosphatase A
MANAYRLTCIKFTIYAFVIDLFIIAAMAIMIWLAVHVSNIIVKATKETDPSYIVIDEWVGMWIALWPIRWHIAFCFIGHSHCHLPVLGLCSWAYVALIALIAFISFRIFDIWKPWPIRQLQILPGGQGIVVDDMIAGFYSIPIVVLASVLAKGLLSALVSKHGTCCP